MPQKGFASTHWTVIRACVGDDTVAASAREELCRDYWYPVYAHLRRSGLQEHDAKDLTQDFFAHVLGSPWIERADSRKGRFRSFLLASLGNFLKDELKHRGGYRRGGGFHHTPLDLAEGAARYEQSHPGNVDLQEAYEMEWASTILKVSLRRLETEHDAAGREEHYRWLRPFLTSEGSVHPYEEAARALGTTPDNVKVSVHRLRKRFGSILREEVARTVAAPSDVDEEMRHIRQILASVPS